MIENQKKVNHSSYPLGIEERKVCRKKIVRPKKKKVRTKKIKARARAWGDPFVVVRAIPIDMFPHTPHCEVVVLLER